MTGSLTTARRQHTATMLPNGKVLVVGGQNDQGRLATTELYDPASGLWTTTGPLNNARYKHTATLLPNGKVLVAGGTGSSGVLSSAELYDPATGTWTVTGSMTAARQWHTATLLPNGKVLVAGGTGSGGALSSAELYDPTTGTWTATGVLSSPDATLTQQPCYRTAKCCSPGDTIKLGPSFPARNFTIQAPECGQVTGPLKNAREEHTATLAPQWQCACHRGITHVEQRRTVRSGNGHMDGYRRFEHGPISTYGDLTARWKSVDCGRLFYWLLVQRRIV